MACSCIGLTPTVRNASLFSKSVYIHFSSVPQFLRVVEACAGFLSKSLHLDSCIGILNLAESHAIPSLKTRAQDFIISQFTKVVALKDFLELPADSLEAVLQSDDLNVTFEELVFEALLRWVKAQQDKRSPLLARLLSHVRLPLLEPAYFVNNVESNELVRQCSEAFPLLQEARKYHLSGREVRKETETKSITYPNDQEKKQQQQ